jgi:hypothetical protein
MKKFILIQIRIKTKLCVYRKCPNEGFMKNIHHI